MRGEGGLAGFGSVSSPPCPLLSHCCHIQPPQGRALLWEATKSYSRERNSDGESKALGGWEGELVITVRFFAWRIHIDAPVHSLTAKNKFSVFV